MQNALLEVSFVLLARSCIHSYLVHSEAHICCLNHSFLYESALLAIMISTCCWREVLISSSLAFLSAHAQSIRSLSYFSNLLAYNVFIQTQPHHQSLSLILKCLLIFQRVINWYLSLWGVNETKRAWFYAVFPILSLASCCEWFIIFTLF